MKREHIYIAGPPRSGTTMLELIVSAHSEVTITPETHFIQKVLRKKYLVPACLSPEKLAAIKQAMQNDKKLNSWPCFDVNKFFARADFSAPTLSELLDALFLAFASANQSGSRYLGNKKGLYADGFGPYIKRLHKDARFIFIVRDPRDVVRSIVKNLAARELQNAAFTCCRREYYISWLQKKYPEDVMVIRYEDLVTEPEEICRRLTVFLGLEYEAGMISFYEKNRDGSRLLGLTKDIHTNTTNNFNPSLIGQWEKENCFSLRELKAIENINYKYMKKYGYRPKSKFSILMVKVTGLFYALKLRLHHLKRILEYNR